MLHPSKRDTGYGARPFLAIFAVFLILVSCSLSVLFLVTTSNGGFGHVGLVQDRTVTGAQRECNSAPRSARPPDNHVVDLRAVRRRCDMTRYNAEHCLDFLNSGEDDYIVSHEELGLPKPVACTEEEEPALYHVFWKGPLTDKLALMIKSFLFTQRLECSRLWIWCDGNILTGSKDEQFLSGIGTYVHFQKWDTEEQIIHLSFPDEWKPRLRGLRTVSLSDMVRFVVLHRYGGMYMDADVVFLRDMRPLYHAQFEYAYQWSYKSEYNTAALRLYPNGTTSRTVISKAMAEGGSFHPFHIKQYLKEAVGTNGDVESMLKMLPVPLFDPLWLRQDQRQPFSLTRPNLRTFNEAFAENLTVDEFPSRKWSVRDRRIEDFFRGAFGYHWHNNWRTPIVRSSWMGVLSTAYNDFLKGRRRNLYGEMAPFLGEQI